jgi:hypothetical protein
MDIGIDEENLRLSRIVSLRSYGNLEQYGIYFLTGEACAIGQRLLFDLDEEGVRHLERFLGGSVSVQEGSNVNHRQGQMASVLLPSATVWELALNIAWNENLSAEYIVGAGDRIFEGTAAEAASLAVHLLAKMDQKKAEAGVDEWHAGLSLD